MPIIRRKLDPSTVYPANIRYNADTDTVQSNVNGDWVDNPAADPRNQTTLPPRLTSDTACDAAQSVVDAIKGQIDGTVEAIDNSSTLFTIAGIILSFLSFGVFAVLVDLVLFIADQMVAAGSAAIEAALTEDAYDKLKCALKCHMNGSGRLVSGGLAAVQAEIGITVGGLGASIINQMLQLAGEGGVNNLASLGTATGECGDCDECGCGFVTNADVGGWDRWLLLEENLAPSDFPNGLQLIFAPVDGMPAPLGTTAAYWNDGYSGAIGMMTEFDAPCHVLSLSVTISGFEGNVARMAAGYRVGGVWTLIDNIVRDPWGANQGFDLDVECDAVGFQ